MLYANLPNTARDAAANAQIIHTIDFASGTAYRGAGTSAGASKAGKTGATCVAIDVTLPAVVGVAS